MAGSHLIIRVCVPSIDLKEKNRLQAQTRGLTSISRAQGAIGLGNCFSLVVLQQDFGVSWLEHDVPGLLNLQLASKDVCVEFLRQHRSTHELHIDEKFHRFWYSEFLFAHLGSFRSVVLSIDNRRTRVSKYS